jgi:ABC-type sulfate transport system substrate-binding protein
MSSIVLSDSSLADQALDIAALVSRSKPEAERSDYINSWSTKAAEAAEDQAKRDEVVQALVAEVKTLGDGTERGE